MSKAAAREGVGTFTVYGEPAKHKVHRLRIRIDMGILRSE
jgi:hypothetical protein